MKLCSLLPALSLALSAAAVPAVAQIVVPVNPINVIPCPVDIDDDVYFTTGSAIDLGYGKYRKTITFHNNGVTAIQGVVSAVVVPISSGWATRNHRGVTKCGPSGVNPFFQLDSGPDHRFMPGETISIDMEYEVASGAAASFAVYVMAGFSIMPMPIAGDFDRDGRADFTVLNGQGKTFHHRLSADASFPVVPFDVPESDIRPIIADYDGDQVPDYSYWIPSQKIWRIRYSSTGTTSVHGYGYGGPVYPAPADYDGDGKVDRAVYISADRRFVASLTRCRCQQVVQVPHNPSYSYTFKPASADYDGDGRAEYALMRVDNAMFRIRNASGVFYDVTLPVPSSAFGTPVPADYDGDGRADLAAYVPATGTWYIRRSSTNADYTRVLGLPNVSIAVPMDVDGDGRTDPGIYTPVLGGFVVKPVSNKERNCTLGDNSGAYIPAITPLQQLY